MQLCVLPTNYHKLDAVRKESNMESSTCFNQIKFELWPHSRQKCPAAYEYTVYKYCIS